LKKVHLLILSLKLMAYWSCQCSYSCAKLTNYICLAIHILCILMTKFAGGMLCISDGHTFVYLLHRYCYRYIVSNDRYKRTPSVIFL
jgi:hypothetical protein